MKRVLALLAVVFAASSVFAQPVDWDNCELCRSDRRDCIKIYRQIYRDCKALDKQAFTQCEKDVDDCSDPNGTEPCLYPECRLDRNAPECKAVVQEEHDRCADWYLVDKKQCTNALDLDLSNCFLGFQSCAEFWCRDKEDDGRVDEEASADDGLTGVTDASFYEGLNGKGCDREMPDVAPLTYGPTGCSSNTRPTFTWSTVASARYYKLVVWEVPGDDSDPVRLFDAVTGSPSTLPWDLEPGKQYAWQVSAENCAGSGPITERKTFTITDDCRPPDVPPDIVQPRGCVDLVRPTFAWSLVPRATGYRIVVSPFDHDDFFIDKFMPASATTLVSPVALNPLVQYRFKVRGVSDAGVGPWSEIVSFTPFCGGVASTLISPHACVSTSTPVFSWTNVPPAINYWLLVSDNPDFSATTTHWLINQYLTGTSFATPPGVSFVPGTTYYWKVKTLLDPTSTTAAAWTATAPFMTSCQPYDAVVLSQSVPSSMASGRPYSVSFTLENTGPTAWTTAALDQLALWSANIWGTIRAPLAQTVEPGEEVTLNFTVTAPAAPGTYIMQWKMIHEAQGQSWFGQITPPATVNVYPPPVAVANEMAAVNGATVTLTWTDTNSNETGTRIERLDPSITTWKYAGSAAENVTTFTDTVDPPPSPTVVYQYRIAAVNDAGQSRWKLVSTAPTSDAAAIAHTIPTMTVVGRTVPVSITMRNTGQSIWSSSDGFSLGLVAPASWGVSTVPLPATVQPGQDVTFNFNVTAPAVAGTYNSQWQMQQPADAGGWFGQTTSTIAVSVVASVPDTPMLVTPVNCVATLRPQFRWNAAARASRYQLAVATFDPENWIINQSDITTMTYTPAFDLAANTQYRFKVRACNELGCSPWSSSKYFKPMCSTVPTITSPLGCIGTQIPAFQWTASPGATSYWLLVGSSADFSAPTTVRYVDINTGATSYAPGLSFSPAATYYAKVKSLGGPYVGWSATISFKPLCTETSPP